MSYISLFSFVKNLSIMGSVLIIILVVFRRYFKNEFSAKWSYSLWGLVLIRFILPVLPKPISRYLTIYKFFFMNKYTYKASDLIFGRKSDVINHYTIIDKTFTLNETIAQSFDRGWSYYLAIGWAIGVVILSSVLILAWLRVRNIRRDSWEMVPRKDTNVVKKCLEQVPIRKKVHMRISNKISVPLASGIIKPIIILPEQLYNIMNEEELSYIVMHELVHIKRRDVLFTYMSSIICVINWFNPLVWGAYLLSKRDCELACDESVLELLSADEAKAYGLTILKTLEYISKKRPDSYKMMNIVLVKTLISNRKEIGGRISNVACYEKKPQVVVFMSLAILLSLSVFSLNDGSNEKRGHVYLFEEIPRYLGLTDKALIDSLGEYPYQKYNVDTMGGQPYVFSYDFIGTEVQFWFDGTIDSDDKSVEEITLSRYAGISRGMAEKEVQERFDSEFRRRPIQSTNAYFIKYEFVNQGVKGENYKVTFNIDKLSKKLYSISIEAVR